MRIVRIYINLMALLVLLAAATSCDKEETASTLKTKAGRIYSFAIEQREDPNATRDEGIRSVTLLFLNQSEEIVQMEEIGKDKISSDDDPVLEGTIATLEVTTSATSLYAFANLESGNLTNRPDWKVGAKFNPQTIAKIAGPNALAVAPNQAIPMSSYRYTIPKQGGTQTNPVTIGPICLYRMIAKVEVTLRNNTDAKITINALSLKNFQHRDIYLLPYEGLDKVTDDDETNKESVPPVFPSEPTITSYYSLPIVSANIPIAANAEMPTYTHYIHETDLGKNYIQVSAEIDGREETKVNTQFSFVRRNDYLKIPLLLEKNQLVITLIESYAPIGGYPFENTLEGTEISVHEGSVVQLTVSVENSMGAFVPDNLTLTHGSGPKLLHYDENADETGTYIAQIPAQLTNELSTYTLTGKLGGTDYKHDLTFKVVNLGTNSTQATKSASRSAGARLVLEEFYQLSCQTDE